MNIDKIVAAGVALAAFAASAAHIYSVAVSAGNSPYIAAVHPIAIDMLIYIGIRAISNGKRVEGWLATAYGVVMSLAFNAVSYAHVDMPAGVMAAAMPVALILAVLVVGHEVKDTTRAKAKTERKVSTMSTPKVDMPKPVSSVPAPIPSAARPAEWDRGLARQLLAEGKPHSEVATRAGCSTKTIQRYARDLNGV